MVWFILNIKEDSIEAIYGAREMVQPLWEWTDVAEALDQLPGLASGSSKPHGPPTLGHQRVSYDFFGHLPSLLLLYIYMIKIIENPHKYVLKCLEN